MARNDSDKNAEPRRYMQSIVVTTIVVVAVFVFLSVVSEEETFEASSLRKKLSGEWQGKKQSGVSTKANELCANVCTQRRLKRTGGVDLLDRKELLKQVLDAKDFLLTKLKKDYGEYFDPIFVNKETGKYRAIKAMNEDSMATLKRKLMIKVLSMQSTLASRDSDFHGCDCSSGKDMALREDILDLDPDDTSLLFEGIDNNDATFEKYVWATGGHSASAGHGNLYNETYTAYMERDLKVIFGSVGIDFEARNYAMGGTSSATIVSMCHKEIFGEDLDFFSWDYGMTDGKNTGKAFHYGYRGAMSPSRPAMLLFHAGAGSKGRGRFDAIKSLVDIGLAGFYEDHDEATVIKDNFPDSAAMTTEEAKALPEYVRNYRCGTGIEKGEPFCQAEKFTTWGCEGKRMKQTSWHPGFKDHAKDGHVIALFLMEVLIEALQNLVENDLEDTELLLSQLMEMDIELHKNFTNAELPPIHEKLFDLKEVKVGENEPKIESSLFTKGKSMCHTARLPSQTRYLGILTNTSEVGQPAPFGKETYFVGTDKKQASWVATENGEMRLVFEIKKEREEKCTGHIVKPDYPDYFYTNHLDGWTSLKFPNEAEKEFYRYNPRDHAGIIVMHFRKCDWNKCPKNYLTFEDYAEKHWEMKLNGQRVTKLITIDDRSTLLQGENGVHFDPDENGQYQIEMKVNKQDGYVEFASFVLY